MTVVLTEELKRTIGHIAVDESKNTSEVVRDLLTEALGARAGRVSA